MRSFRDSSGRSWDLVIDIPTARKIRARTGIDVHSLFTEKTLMSLHDDIDVTSEMLWAAIERQALERGVESFDDLTAGEKPAIDSDIFEAAFDEFFDAVVDYLPEKKRRAAAKLLRVLRKAGNQAMSTALQELDRVDEEAIGEEIRQAINSTLGAGSTSSPGS